MSGYGQENTPPGLINASPTLGVKYGVPVPMFLSQPGFEGADLADPMLTGVQKDKRYEADVVQYNSVMLGFVSNFYGGMLAQTHKIQLSRYIQSGN